MKTTFGTWKKPIDLLNVATVPLAFVVEMVNKLRPAYISDGFSKVVIFQHPLNVQVLNGYELVLLYQKIINLQILLTQNKEI